LQKYHLMMKRSFLTMLTAILFINTAIDHLVSAMVISTSTKVANHLFTGIWPAHLNK